MGMRWGRLTEDRQQGQGWLGGRWGRLREESTGTELRDVEGVGGLWPSFRPPWEGMGPTAPPTQVSYNSDGLNS